MTHIPAFSIKSAVAYIRGSDFDRRTFHAAQATIIRAGLCPNCLCDSEPMRSRLGRWTPGNYYEHAGRECPNCEEFFPCGEQPEYQTAADEWRGDADPGL